MKNNNNLKILVVVLVVIILGLGGFIIYDKVLKDNNKINTNYKYTMNIYKDEYNNLCYEKYDHCNEIAYSLKTETKAAKIVYIKDKYILYNDKSLKLYNLDTKKTKIIYLNDEYKNYKLLNEEYLSFVKDDYLYLFDINTANKEISVSLSNEFNYPNFELYTYNDKNVFIAMNNAPDGNFPGDIIKIYNNDKKEIIDGKDIKNLVIYKEYIYYNDNGLVKKYDIDGKVVDTIKVDAFKNFYYNNIVYIKNNELMLENINSRKTIKIADITNSDIQVESYYYENDNSFYDYQYYKPMEGCTDSGDSEVLKKIKKGLAISSTNDKEYTIYDLDDNFKVTSYKIKKALICGG